ncbi:uncharacterized protein si:dkey-154b15.1 isoform X2 [Sander lucioperca]|uniref:uncharacterized protein si:dkey-154b15.1 isoform X2 n=1 Tax=Sander lucioperca TaxID=283035 RepID=UPI00165385A9|nr:uncharacterized protein si:dkey-154b15.1 isoform X2 [Sander lucioperca]
MTTLLSVSSPLIKSSHEVKRNELLTKHGGGEVLKVLYPCNQPGQAFITFEEPEVAARVLRKGSHVLELNGQKYHLTVKAPEHLEMDLPVEATVHLNIFHNKAEVREILRSNGFALTDLSSDQVRVKGSFLKLRTVKASLEQLLQSQTKTGITPVPKASSGAISKYYTSNSSVTHGNGSQLGSREMPPQASPSSPTTSSSWASGSSKKHPTSPEYRASFSPRPDQRGSFRAGRESFVIDADVFRYADRLRKKDIEGILNSHNVTMEKHEVGDSFNITLLGKSVSVAVGKLQSLLNDLNKSLRTQEVPLKDMDREGRDLLERIRKDKNIYNLVLVCPMNDKLHLIGPSGESYELKLRLLGRSVDQSGRTGRTPSRRRSSSLPPIRRKNTDRDSRAIAYPSPIAAAGYSPSKYRDDKQEGAERERGATASFGPRGRSHSESRGKTKAESINVQEVVTKPPKSPRQALIQCISKDIKKKFKSLRK